MFAKKPLRPLFIEQVPKVLKRFIECIKRKLLKADRDMVNSTIMSIMLNYNGVDFFLQGQDFYMYITDIPEHQVV